MTGKTVRISRTLSRMGEQMARMMMVRTITGTATTRTTGTTMGMATRTKSTTRTTGTGLATTRMVGMARAAEEARRRSRGLSDQKRRRNII